MKPKCYGLSLITLITILFANELNAQSFSSITGGNYGNPFTWGVIIIGTGVPDSTNNVLINGSVSGITVNSEQHCKNLTLNGDLTIEDGANFYIHGNLTCGSSSTITIDSGNIFIDGFYDKDGTLTINQNNANSIQVDGNVLQDGNTRVNNENGGSLVIFSDLN